MVAIVPAAPASLPHPQPVGGPVADTAKTLAFDKSLRQARREMVFTLPVRAQPAQDRAQNVAGQMGSPHLGQNEKTAIVNDETEPLLALLSAPADEGITGLYLPGRSCKEHAGQVASVTVPNKVTQVLTCGALEAQIMMLRQMPNKGVGLHRARLDADHLQRLKSSQRTLDQVPGASSQRKEFGLRERTQNLTSTAALPRRQLDEPSFGQLVQQQPGRHVFELSARRAPVEHFAQCDRQLPPTPPPMFGDHLLERLEIFGA